MKWNIDAGLFMAALLPAELIYAINLPKRPFFPGRYAFQALFCLAAAFLYPELIPILSLHRFLMYFSLFVLTVLGMLWCFNEKARIIATVAILGFVTQHLVTELCIVVDLGTALFQSPWAAPAGVAVKTLLFIGVYSFALFRLSGENTIKTAGSFDNINFRINLVLFLVICVGTTRLTHDIPNRPPVTVLANSLQDILCCILALNVHFGIIKQIDLQSESFVLKYMLREDKKQYEQWKDSIDVINVKYHDLKHQLVKLKGSVSGSFIKEVEEAATTYESVMQTGNDVIDIILTEKSLQCKKNHIVLSSVVDGKILNFIDNADLYSLFGNALSNAIDEVKKLPDEEMRVISLIVRRIGDLVSIHFGNYYEGELEFQNGLPQTRKDDGVYHGFGMKSIDMIARKYGGTIEITTEDQMFCLDILIPREA